MVGRAGEAEEELEEPAGGDGDQRPSFPKGRIFPERRFQPPQPAFVLPAAEIGFRDRTNFSQSWM